MSECCGYIYIFTNPSFPEYVKIGYADNVEKRLKDLNRSECTPFAFRVYAHYKVSVRLSDMKLHNIIDKLNPDLRSIDNVNGKKRVREFYKISKQDAYYLFEAIAEINGNLDKLVLVKPTEKEVEEEIIAESNDEHNYYTEESHLAKASPIVVDLFDSIKSVATDRWHLDMHCKKQYIAFKRDGKNVFDIAVMRNKLKVYINAPKGKLVDPLCYARDISEVGHWGNGDYEVLLSTKDEFDYLVTLIQQVL